MTRGVIYVRKSQNGTGDEGCTEANQRARTLDYCASNEIEPVETIVDMLQTSKTLKRPGVKRALAMIEAGEVDALVIYRLDRLTRSLADLTALLEGPFAPGRAQLHSIHEKLDTSSATGRMLVNILGTVNQWQREIIGENTRETLQTMVSQGAKLGGAPYGWRKVAGPGGKLTALEAIPAQQAIIFEVREMWGIGKLSQKTIAALMNERGRPAPKGAKWSRRSVQCILATPEVS